MTVQTLTIGKRRYVVVPESDFNRLQRKAGAREVRPQFAADAMRELNAYRKTRKAANWSQVKRRLGL
jgi:hypothetical protein